MYKRQVYAFRREPWLYNAGMKPDLTNSLRPYLGRLPVLGARVYVDPAATIIGDVELGDDVSLWPGTILRGDVNFIRIGARTNVQDGTIIHVSHHSPYNKVCLLYTSRCV